MSRSDPSAGTGISNGIGTGILGRLAGIIRLRTFLGDRRGVSAIEFALVAPVLVCAYLGLAELTLGMMASRRTSHLAATIGDLSAQSESLNAANISDLWAIGTSMLQPFDTGGNLKMRLSSVKMGTDSIARVDWSSAQNFSPYAKLTQIPAVTTAQITSGQCLMMTEVEYDYDSPIGSLFPGTTKFTDTFYHHPRNGNCVVGPT